VLITDLIHKFDLSVKAPLLCQLPTRQRVIKGFQGIDSLNTNDINKKYKSGNIINDIYTNIEIDANNSRVLRHKKALLNLTLTGRARSL
jgi:phosphomevalonate kinase